MPMSTAKELDKHRRFDDELRMAQKDQKDFGFVLKWGGRPATAARLREAGLDVGSGDIFNWVRRESLPWPVALNVMKILKKDKVPIKVEHFTLKTPKKQRKKSEERAPA